MKKIFCSVMSLALMMGMFTIQVLANDDTSEIPVDILIEFSSTTKEETIAEVYKRAVEENPNQRVIMIENDLGRSFTDAENTAVGNLVYTGRIETAMIDGQPVVRAQMEYLPQLIEDNSIDTQDLIHKWRIYYSYTRKEESSSESYCYKSYRVTLEECVNDNCNKTRSSEDYTGKVNHHYEQTYPATDYKTCTICKKTFDR